MSSPHLIALIGFEAFEYTTLESFFSLATRREPGHAIVSEAVQADLLLLNAENSGELVAALRQRRPSQRVLVIGASTRPEARGLPVQMRPIRFMSLLAVADQLLAAPAPAPTPAPHAASAAPNFEATQPIARADVLASQMPSFAATQPYAPLQRDFGPSSAPAFAATQPYAPLDAADTASSTGFAPTRPAAVPVQPVLPRPVMPTAPALRIERREDLITTESLAAYKRPQAPAAPAAPAVSTVAAAVPVVAGPAAAPVAAPVIAPIPAAAPAAASAAAPARVSRSDFLGSTGFLGLGGGAAPVTPAQPIDDVLVVDDDDLAQRHMQNRLGRLGFRVTLARSGPDALAALPSRHFRFVFLDIMMQGMDGLQTCRALKKQAAAQGQSLLVFVLSSRGGVFEKMRASLAGADAYLIKPLNEPEFKKLLAKHEMRSTNAYAPTRLVGSSVSLPASGLERRP